MVYTIVQYAVANKIGKEYFWLLKKNFIPSDGLYEILNRNTIELNNSTMPHVARLNNKRNIKKLRKNQRTELAKCNYTNKTNCPTKGKSQFECLMYKVEVHSCRSNDSNVSINDKKKYT